jgi:hypothetical protein
MYGPYELARDDELILAKQEAMWAEVRETSMKYDHPEKSLEQSIGCYAFGIKYGSSLKPWYIGMTIAKNGFRSEVLQDHKREHYNEVIKDHQGTPVLFLMPLLTPEGRFSRSRKKNKHLIEWVEKMLFGVAIKRNQECRNQRDTKNVRNVVVHGIFNSRPVGRQGPTVKAARAMFGNS